MKTDQSTFGTGVIRHVRIAACAGMAVLSAAAIVAPIPAAGRPHLAVYFVQGEQLAPVNRSGATPLDAVRQLVAGPSSVERRHGFRSYIPVTTRVRSVTVADGLATVDLTEPFVTGTNRDTMLARLSQLVRTLTGLQGTARVQLLIDGAPTAGMFPDVSTSGPITLKFLETPNISPPTPRRQRLPPPDASIKATQQRLIAVGYLLPGDDDGRFGSATQNAILAFQKWEGLDRTGLLDRATKLRLARAQHPSAITHRGPGKRAEILLDRQVALLIDNDRVVRTIAISSGKASTPTPPGNYRVYAKIPRWWSVPFREWLPYALPFVGGIALHEFEDVPAYPASHGCVRQSDTVASWTYRFSYVGMPVTVISRSAKRPA